MNLLADDAIIIPGVASYRVDTEGQLLEWSPGLLAFHGLSGPREAPAGFLTLIAPEDRDLMRQALSAALAAGGTFEHRYRLAGATGKGRQVLDRGRVIRDAQGHPAGLAGVQIDVTDLAAEQGQAAQGPAAADPSEPRPAQILDSIFEDAPIGIGIWDRELKFRMVNRRLAEMNGLPAADHIGKTVSELLPDVADIEAVTALFSSVLQDGKTIRDIAITGSTPAAPEETRHWNEHFFPIRTADGVAGVAAFAEDVTDALRSQQRVDALIRELNHRSKNLVTLILAISRQTARHQPEDFQNVFRARLEGMVAAQDLLISRQMSEIGVHALIRSQLPHVSEMLGSRILMSGDESLVVPAEFVQTLAMAFHEMTTNATKYGALSGDEGVVRIVCEKKPGDDRLRISWHEEGGPVVLPPQRRGFGSSLIGPMIEGSFGAHVEVDYPPTGFSWSVSLPVAPVAEL